MNDNTRTTTLGRDDIPFIIRPASVGSVSEGTLRNEDLGPAFAAELEYQIKRQPARFARAECRKLINEANRRTRNDAWDSEDDFGSDLVNSLSDALEQFAPAYGYFGAIEGDGACFGFWISDPRDAGFDGIEVGDTSEVPAGYRGEVLHVSDHGNMSLYLASGGKLKEVWAVV